MDIAVDKIEPSNKYSASALFPIYLAELRKINRSEVGALDGDSKLLLLYIPDGEQH
ncbi:hypothetical protein SAMN04487911_12530 [Arenibacter nanhaiticus]|uniref:Uncharacterized protein n=1 Tax=Arenibacter nanhaiticus TaxID=558155 RepID=A0A1M6KCP3_9FLAO|nr:hypothetical protein SAMN04487911_12530 [Arenibacter nanhaiticus]